MTGENARHRLLEDIAVAGAGERDADKLLTVWHNVREAQKAGDFLRTGAAIVYGGVVMNRWLTRPLVPFPDELEPEEKEYYRKFIMQARTEKHADNLTDLQATELFSGWSGYHRGSKSVTGKLRAPRKAVSGAKP